MSSPIGTDADVRPRTPVAERSHRLHWFAGRAHDVLDSLGDPVSWSLTGADREETIRDLLALQARVQQQVLTLVADADRGDPAMVGSTPGAVSTAAWLRSFTRETPRAVARMVKDARALDGYDATRAALAAGDVNLDQAREITAAIDALPDEVADDAPAAEAHLLGEARSHDAVALRALGRHLVEVIAPDHADRLLHQRLEAEEQAARRRTSLRLTDDGQGTTRGTFTIPTLHGIILRKLLESFANPQRPDTPARDGSDHRSRTRPQILGDAFTHLLETIPADWVPSSGGTHLTVVVTMTLDTLLGGLQTAGILGEHHRISATEARRLACIAGVIPAVLGSRSEVLDLGRRSRLHTRPQRLAMALTQDGLCVVEHCDRPTTWADAHHLTPWSHGGHTTTNDGVLICARHHTLIHDPRLQTQHLPDGGIRFHRRT